MNCNHDWTPWEYKSYENGHYDVITWWTRTCKKCGLVQKSEVVDTDEHILGGTCESTGIPKRSKKNS